MSSSSHCLLQKSKKNLSAFFIPYHFQKKKDLKSEYWPRLTKGKAKNTFLKTDFSKWVDEDKQNGDTATADDLGPDMGMGGMGGGTDFEQASSPQQIISITDLSIFR
jgi:hypothetical protein